jgi:putative FmdB family regulatory protein
MSGIMSVYEFYCATCGRKFYLSLSDYEDKAHACPACGSKETERVSENPVSVASEKS